MVFYTQAMFQAAFLLIASHFTADQEKHDALGARTTFDRDIPYDYIVVGAGAAGCVVASRLSENPNVRVLLLETGGTQDATVDIPAMDALAVLAGTPNLFRFKVEPQEHGALGFTGGQFRTVTGRIIGGGTSVNGMAYNRGGRLDFDGWAKHFKLDGWSYEEVLPFFKKSENQIDLDFAKTRYHGSGGPVTVRSQNLSQMSESYHRMTKTVMDVALSRGMRMTDFNGAENIGVNTFQRTVGADGKRVTAAKAFLTPAQNRPNLHILTRATVTRVLFEGKRAKGVAFTFRGRNETAHVTKIGGEVIMSAGTINSARLLLLSGVGPKDDLEKLGIPLVANLPVGQNFQDRPRIGGADFVCEKQIFDNWQDLFTVENLHNFYSKAEGPLANNYYSHQGTTINNRTSVPDRGILFGPADHFIAPAVIPAGYIFLGVDDSPNPKIMQQYYGPYFFKNHTLNLFTSLNYVISRGYVKLRSADPADPPIVNPRYLSHPDDVSRVVEAHKNAMSYADSPAFKAIGCRPYEFPLPGCEHLFGAPESDAYVECKVRHLSASELHPGGTCRMAGGDDPTAVVDPELKVRGGVEGLRVIDASIMPQLVTANTMTSTIMIGERGADFIIKERRRKGLPL